MSQFARNCQCSNDVKTVPFDICTTEDSPFATSKMRKFDGTEVSHSTSFKRGSVASLNKNVLHLVSNRQSGMCLNTNFASRFSSIKSKEMTVSTFLSFNGPQEWNFVKQSHDGKGLLASWRKGPISEIYDINFQFRDETELQRCRRTSLVRTMVESNRIAADGVVADMCHLSRVGRNCFLYVSNSQNAKGERECRTMEVDFTSRNNYRRLCDKLSNREIYSCAGNGNGKIFATGTDQGFRLFNAGYFSHEINMQAKVLCVDFNYSGNTLYAGIEGVGLSALDLRQPVIDQTPNCCLYSRRGISQMKLLSDEKSVVVSDETGLSKVDFRKSKQVLKYERYSSFGRGTSLSLNESHDILCATGSDNLTRLWSIRTGKHLHTIGPQLCNLIDVHSCVIADGNKWFVSLLQSDKIYIVEPCITS